MSTHPSRSPVELEIKFDLPPGGEAALVDHPLMRSGQQTRHEVTTYFDTPAGDLAREGFSLRVRSHEKRRVQTLKLRCNGEGPFGRNEWEWQVETGHAGA